MGEMWQDFDEILARFYQVGLKAPSSTSHVPLFLEAIQPGINTEVICFCQFIVACLLHLSIFDMQISLSSGVVTSQGDACNMQAKLEIDMSRTSQ